MAPLTLTTLIVVPNMVLDVKKSFIVTLHPFIMVKALEVIIGVVREPGPRKSVALWGRYIHLI